MKEQPPLRKKIVYILGFIEKLGHKIVNYIMILQEFIGVSSKFMWFSRGYLDNLKQNSYIIV